MLSHEENRFFDPGRAGNSGGAIAQTLLARGCGGSELSEEKPKKRVRILGEDLLLYRDPSGGYGLVRRALLASRRIALLRLCRRLAAFAAPITVGNTMLCGKCVDQPFENPESGFQDKIQHTAYPVEKLAGLFFAYMGPADKKPLLPKWDLLVRPDGVKKIDVCEVLQCNWLQAMENSVDPTHTYYLHSHTLKLKGDKDYVPFHYQQLNKIDFELVVEPNWAGIQKQRIFAGDGVPARSAAPADLPEHSFRPCAHRIRHAFSHADRRLEHASFSISFQPDQRRQRRRTAGRSAGGIHRDEK